MALKEHNLSLETITPGLIAKYCDVNVRTVTRWINQGHLKAYKLPGRGNNRILLKDFLHFVQSHNMPVPEQLTGSPNKILVVDDDVNMAKSIERLIRRAKYQTEMANNAFDAGIKLGTFHPDLIILDLSMPGANGYDVIRLIRRTISDNRTKILVVSALSKKELLEAVALGAQDYLQKPFDNESLINKVKKLLNTKEVS